MRFLEDINERATERLDVRVSGDKLGLFVNCKAESIEHAMERELHDEDYVDISLY